jgi:hypothetical protein
MLKRLALVNLEKVAVGGHGATFGEGHGASPITHLKPANVAHAEKLYPAQAILAVEVLGKTVEVGGSEHLVFFKDRVSVHEFR